MKFKLVREARRKRAQSVRGQTASRYRGLRIEALEERRMLDASTPWQNPSAPLDVNGDGLVTPIDALLIINRLNTIGPGNVPDLSDASPPPYYDTSGDNVITALDALKVIAALNDHSQGPTLNAGLFNMVAIDGKPSTDGTTADARIAGTVTGPNQIKAFTVQIDGGPASNLLPTLQPDGSFLLSQNVLAAATAGGALVDGSHTFYFNVVDQSGLVATKTVSLQLHRLALSVAPFSDDITPQVTVQVASSMSLPNGTPVEIDVDFNDDGQYDSSELDYAEGTLYNGAATFQITPSMPTSQEVGGPYNVHFRARVQSISGAQQLADSQSVQFNTTTSDVLKDYVDFNDGKFQWNLVSTVPGVGYTAYTINLISQQWLTPGDVSQSLWQHWVTIIVPSGALAPTALLFIDGGSNTATPPVLTDNPLAAPFIQAAISTHSVVIDLPEVPNEPETFSGEDPPVARSEDALIAYTFDHFLDDTSDPDWLALLPMTKSAVKAMDMVQAFIPTVGTHQQITNFVVSGASKRGWTTWLTAAVDDRVIAIAPMVFDALNLDEQMVHHYGAYGFFSPAIQDYEDLHVFDRIETDQGQDLGEIVDPYRYIYDGRYNIPKLLIDSSGDQFFLPDSAQFYIHDLPGPTYLQYIPNTDHLLNNDAVNSVLTFYSSIITGSPLPQYSWTVEADGSLRAQTTTTPTQVLLWQATNPDARDFRKDYTNVVYTSTPLSDQGGGVYTANVPTPATGATAFFIEFTFPSPVPGLSYKFTTEIRVTTNQELFPWPFPIGDSSDDSGLVLAGGAPPVGGALVTSTQGETAAEAAAAAAFAGLTFAPPLAPSSPILGTQGIAAVVTTLQVPSSATPVIVAADEEDGLQDPLLNGATAGAGVAINSDGAETLSDSPDDSDDLLASLQELSLGRRLPIA